MSNLDIPINLDASLSTHVQHALHVTPSLTRTDYSSYKHVMSRKTGRDKDGLTPKERTFVKNYLASNGEVGESAIAAGYLGHKAGSRLLKRAHVWRVIEMTMRARLSHLDVKAERVLLETVRIALADPRKFFEADGRVLSNPHDWPADLAAAVSAFEFSPKTGLLTKIKLWNKVDSLQLLGQYLKLWEGAGDAPEDHLQEIVDALKESHEMWSKEDKTTVH